MGISLINILSRLDTEDSFTVYIRICMLLQGGTYCTFFVFMNIAYKIELYTHIYVY